MTVTFDPTDLRRAFAAFPSGVVAVAAQVDGVPVGLAASSFTSVSLEPALVSFSIARTSTTWPVLRRAGHIGLSVLASHHHDACRRLAGPTGQRFEGLALRETPEGAVLLEDAVVAFDCTIDREIEAGDHLIVLLALEAVEHPRDAAPLVFHQSRFRQIQSASAGLAAAG